MAVTNLAVARHTIIEHVDRRVLGAFQLVDAVTGLPVAGPARIEVRRATVAGAGGPEEISLPDDAVRIVQNRSGAFVLFRVPSFEEYTASFDPPPAPPSVQLQVRVLDAGPQYLPQQFVLALPRPVDPNAVGNVFTPHVVQLLRAPSAPVPEGWATARVSVRTATPSAPAPGVLVRAFRLPRAAQDRPLGAGMTEWRGGVRGEALLAMTGIERFRPGSGPSAVESLQAIELETTRDPAFTGTGDALPDAAALVAATAAGIVRHVDTQAGQLVVALVRPDERPAAPPGLPVHVRAGREYVLQLTLP